MPFSPRTISNTPNPAMSKRTASGSKRAVLPLSRWMTVDAPSLRTQSGQASAA